MRKSLIALGIASLFAASAASAASNDCLQRPEVQEYLGQIRGRMYARWVPPPSMPPASKVQLRFALDPKGSLANAEVASATDAKLGKSALEALRAAAPFPTMTERVRCLAGQSLTAAFELPASGR